MSLHQLGRLEGKTIEQVVVEDDELVTLYLTGGSKAVVSTFVEHVADPDGWAEPVARLDAEVIA